MLDMFAKHSRIGEVAQRLLAQHAAQVKGDTCFRLRLHFQKVNLGVHTDPKNK